MVNKNSDGWFPRPDDVYIGRPSVYGNPFPIAPVGSTELRTRQRVIEKFALYWLERDDWVELTRKLAGKRLVCFCAPQACHGDVLATLANALAEADIPR